MTLQEQMAQLAQRAKAASHAMVSMTTAEKDGCLLAMAKALEDHIPALLQANLQDQHQAASLNLSSAMLDRLQLTEKRIAAMAQGLREVAALPDPVGRVLDERTRPNGLTLRKVAVPIGVVVIIFESRPNVTADAASLCLKSGNASILRGGKEALHSNQAITELMTRAARRALPSFPEHAIQLVPTTDREAIRALLSLTQYIDLCMPRGGEGLIRAVVESSRVPVIKHYKGVCHVLVDREADLAMAQSIVLNAKVQRPAVCNAIETLLIDKPVAAEFLPAIAAELIEHNVELRADPEASAILAQRQLPCKAATERDWSTEYNDYILNIRILDNLSAAIDHINRFGSAHSDSIVTSSQARAERFMREVDSAAVYWNASTRFTDGGQFGMGAEIGISTDKIGARGPMGLEELTTYKWLGYGQGQIRN